MNPLDLNASLPGENRYVSTAQVAKALGVSVTTVKRWVDDEILPALRTVGGHRKLLLNDVLRMAREGNLPQANLASLVPRPLNAELENPPAIREELIRAVLELDVPLIGGIIHGAYRNGYAIETIADQVISPVMVELGHGWETGKIDVAHEHRATQAIVSALYELKALLRGQQLPHRPIAIGGAPEHDHYILPSLLCKLVLMDAGWDPIHLGPHTPISAIISTMEQLKPQLIWISITHLEDVNRFVTEYRELYRRAEERGISIAIGGRGLTEPILQRLEYTTHGGGWRNSLPSLEPSTAFQADRGAGDHGIPYQARKRRRKFGIRNSECGVRSEEVEAEPPAG